MNHAAGPGMARPGKASLRGARHGRLDKARRGLERQGADGPDEARQPRRALARLETAWPDAAASDRLRKARQARRAYARLGEPWQGKAGPALAGMPSLSKAGRGTVSPGGAWKS